MKNAQDVPIISKSYYYNNTYYKEAYVLENLHYLVMKCNAALSRKIMCGANELGLTSGQPKILEFLWNFKEADQKTIAIYCEIEQATVGSILLRMETAGLIVRKQHNGNRRSLYVSLTEKGREKAEKMMGVFKKTDALAMADLSKDEIEMLKGILNKIYKNVSSEVDKNEQHD